MKHEPHSQDKNRKLSSFIIRHSTTQHRKPQLEATIGFKYSLKCEQGFPFLLCEKQKEVDNDKKTLELNKPLQWQSKEKGPGAGSC